MEMWELAKRILASANEGNHLLPLSLGLRIEDISKVLESVSSRQ